MYYDTGAYDMLYAEFKELCHKTWSERLNYVSIDVTENKNEGKFFMFNENKNTLNAFPKLNLFFKINVLSNYKQKRFGKKTS